MTISTRTRTRTIAEARELCEKARFNAGRERTSVVMSDADFELLAAAKIGWPATLDALEAAEAEIERLKKESAHED